LKTEATQFETRDFSTGQVFWNLEAASCRQSSVSATADLLRDNWNNAPSGEEVLTILRAIPEMEAEALCNRVILAQYRELPAEMRRELEQSGTVIFDFHEDPYWGDPGKVAVIKGQKEHDAYFHFVYLTADLVSDHFRFTIYVTSRVEGFPVATYLPALLAQVRQVIEPHLLLFDGEIPTVEALQYLDKELVPWNARKSLTKGVKDALHCYIKDPCQFHHRRWHLVEIKSDNGNKSVHVHVTAQDCYGTLKAIIKPVWYSQPPEEAEANYRRRFAIDAGYKEKHTFHARTSSRSWVVRLLLFTVSILLWNVWRLALVWYLLKGLAPLTPAEALQITMKMVAFQLSEYFLYDGWKL
jgi:hypothetical protein